MVSIRDGKSTHILHSSRSADTHVQKYYRKIFSSTETTYFLTSHLWLICKHSETQGGGGGGGGARGCGGGGGGGLFFFFFFFYNYKKKKKKKKKFLKKK